MGTHTHTNTHIDVCTETILRNLACASLWLVHAWFKNMHLLHKQQSIYCDYNVHSKWSSCSQLQANVFQEQASSLKVKLKAHDHITKSLSKITLVIMRDVRFITFEMKQLTMINGAFNWEAFVLTRQLCYRVLWAHFNTK